MSKISVYIVSLTSLQHVLFKFSTYSEAPAVLCVAVEVADPCVVMVQAGGLRDVERFEEVQTDRLR